MKPNFKQKITSVDADLKNDISKSIDYLRTEAYYEQLDLSFRLDCCRVELFEESKKELFIKRCIEILDIFDSKDDTDLLNSLLNKITFRLYPKSLKEQNEKKQNGRWITNQRTQESYPVESCDFFIEIPLELRVLDTLWSLRVGRKLDNLLPDNCFANRLAPEHHSNMFKLFFNQYKKWRDTGLNRAKKCLENSQSVVLISMDISRCFYNVEVNWECIYKKCDNNNVDFVLTSLIKTIQSKYLLECRPFLSDTGLKISKDRECLLPIGLLSSRILSNWELHKWDKKVENKLNPVYYGRYVDDILLVISNPPTHCTKDLHTLIKHYLLDTNLVDPSDGKDTAYILSETPFRIQEKKLIGTFFDKSHSWAGLTSFIEELQRHNSEFRFLPTDEQGRELENTAFDILMQGSVNKIRSILSICENGTELSKFISSEIVAHRLSATPLNPSVKEQLSRFWKGRNLFEFIRIWEKNFTLLFIKGEKECMSEFWTQTEELISGLTHNNKKLLVKLKRDLRKHRLIAFANMLSLEKQDILEKWQIGPIRYEREVFEMANSIRNAGYPRSQYIVWPFLQFSKYRGNLAQLSLESVIEYLQNDNTTIQKSFRYVYQDEKQLFPLLKNASRGICNLTTMRDFDEEYSNFEIGDEKCPVEITLPNSPLYSKKNITIAIGNLKVPYNNINLSYEPGKKPNLTQERWKKLSNLLNLANKEKCDLLILPEVSIPWAWLSLMTSYARRHRIGLVFGLEHLVVNHKNDKKVVNTVIAALPYYRDGVADCAVIVRSKNHYSPGENEEFKRLNYKLVSPDPKRYHLIHWRNMAFTIFNCYELTDIYHRSIFRGKIDTLIAIEWNRDTEYFSNIVESAARDLHCTIIQTNTSEFGDSRIYCPYYERYKRSMVRVKGGDNMTLLKTSLNFDEQRSFQQRLYSTGDKRYKPTPAGFQYFERNFYPEKSLDSNEQVIDGETEVELNFT